MLTNTVAPFLLAAILEIAGCFAFWLWVRKSASVWFAVIGLISLVGFALTLTRTDIGFAGRAYAAYGGIYIVASLVWLWLVEGQRPTGPDVLGAGVALAGALIIVAWAHR
jgi:small multidrug resistance family-3 protein